MRRTKGDKVIDLMEALKASLAHLPTYAPHAPTSITENRTMYDEKESEPQEGTGSTGAQNTQADSSTSDQGEGSETGADDANTQAPAADPGEPDEAGVTDGKDNVETEAGDVRTI